MKGEGSECKNSEVQKNGKVTFYVVKCGSIIQHGKWCVPLFQGQKENGKRESRIIVMYFNNRKIL